MNIEHKPGVLCVIIGSMTLAGRIYIGKNVELVRIVTPREIVTLPTGEKVRFVGESQGWLVKGDVVSTATGMKGYIFVRQNHLLPIKDPDQDFVEDQRYEVINGKEMFHNIRGSHAHTTQS